MVPQNHHGIDLSGAPHRNAAGGKGNQGQLAPGNPALLTPASNAIDRPEGGG